ncbi:MAG TPA: ParB/RepB/Spo0J family partition protein [Dehalococcoidia bacterium]|jgi:ParB/RepB/Spo0J family partition protein|nr:ParB/RepB/Spo0J family partition protein [Dehalococcoidia bacterium]
MSREFREIELDSLYISPYNVRKDLGDLTELTDSVTDLGVLEPILVRQKGEQYEVIAGSRRLKAARSAGHTTIPASVLELTNVQALLTSLIENIQRKDLTLEERVVTYQQLEALEPAYRNKAALAKVVGRSPQKIGQDLQAYEIALVLAPFGIRVESHFRRTSAERQRGDVLPEYHAVLLHQVSAWFRAKDLIPDDTFVELQAEWARRIAPHSQEKAEEIIAHLKSAADSIDTLVGQKEKPGRRGLSRSTNAQAASDTVAATQQEAGGEVICSCCGQELTLIHLSNGDHQVSRYSMHLPNQQELPGLIS